MPTKLTCFILFAALAFFSCKKEEPLTIVPGPPCRLVSQKWNPSSCAGNYEHYYYSYNKQGLIDTIKRIQQGGAYYSNGEGPFYPKPSTSWIYFKYRQTRVAQSIHTDQSWKWYQQYEYDGDLLTRMTSEKPDGSVEKIYHFYYDSQNRLTEVLDSMKKANFRHLLQYDGGNLVSHETEILWSTPCKKRKQQYDHFDGQQNFAKAIPGLPLPFSIFNTQHIYSTEATHNFQTERYHFSIPIDEEYRDWISSSYTYEYNDQGFPLRMFYAGWEVVFEYECE